GSSKCLDAFILALNQASDGQEKRWYVSTLELQLVSLELCGECRSAQMLDVLVNEHAPPTLWTSRTPRTTPSQRSQEVCTASRVPSVHAFGWTWELPVNRLPQRTAIELQPGPEHRWQDEDSFAGSGGSVVWPHSLKRLVFMSDMPLDTVSWPASLQTLSFENSFNQPIVGIIWPVSLQLSFRDKFNQPIVRVAWPAFLCQLSFGNSFNQPVVGAPWPACLQTLSFGHRFNQPIVGVRWPACLQQISFGYEFNKPVVGATWPACLQQVSFGHRFNQVITDVVWPASLQQLSFGDSFNQQII
ncbi:unnamed protein product, partial [Ectocarpus fasciculatus]